MDEAAGVCGSAETLLVDAACAATHLAPIVKDLLDAGCEVRGDAATRAVDAARRGGRVRIIDQGSLCMWPRATLRSASPAG